MEAASAMCTTFGNGGNSERDGNFEVVEQALDEAFPSVIFAALLLELADVHQQDEDADSKDHLAAEPCTR